MSRLVSSLGHSLAQVKLYSHFLGVSHISRKPTCIQCIRCYRPRKPFWLPIAKSKMFRIPKKPVLPKDENDELSRLNNVYKTNMKSLRQYFKEQVQAQTTAPELIEERKKRLAEQHANCISENDLWNAEVAKLREKRLAIEAVEREKQILENIIAHEREQKLLIEQIDSHVLGEKEASKSFITPSNIDEAIEIAVANIVDHNFAVDLEGNIYKGRYGKPPPKAKTPTAQKSSEQAKPESVEARN